MSTLAAVLIKKVCSNYTVSEQKTVQNFFCHNFVKFLQIFKFFGRKMAKCSKLCEVHSFSTSPNSRHYTTVLNADVPLAYSGINDQLVKLRLLISQKCFELRFLPLEGASNEMCCRLLLSG